MVMSRGQNRRLIVALLFLTITIVFVSPLVSLPGTALRAHRVAQMIFWMLWAWSVVSAGLLCPQSGQILSALFERSSPRLLSPVLALDCAFLC